MDFLFRLFFKYPWSDYRHGHLGFGTTHRTVFFLGLGLLCLAAAYLGYRKKTLPESQRWPFPTKRAILISLRALALGLILFALARPVLSVKTLAPKENIVVLLIDDSRSMNIQDEQSHSRLEAVKSFLKQSPFLGDLGDRFRLRLRRFSDDVDHIDALETLTAEGRLTSLSTALGQVLNEFGSDPLAAVVLFTDGADNGSRPFASTLQQYQAKQIPLYVCGLGQKAMHRDVEISPILPVRKALPESIVSTDVTVWSNGYEGRTTDLELRENGRLILTKPIQLLGHEQSQLVPLNFAVHGQGFRQYTISVRALPDEENGENNSFSFLVDLDSSHSRILYLEGTPRWEFKFIHQAIDQDNSLQLVSLLRTSGNKFYRQGIESESTLASGFPTLREELFKYKALLLGSIESSFFSKEQLAQMADFAGQRGGGLMMLGGTRSFDEGKYGDSPIGEILPVFLGKLTAHPSFTVEPAKVQLSEQGRHHPLTQLDLEADRNEKRWSRLPELEEFNLIREAKPGATVLATLASGQGRTILAAIQRYGKGRTAVFTAADSWLWRMGMPAQDDTFKIFWRQALRWLVSSTPDQVNLELDRTSFFSRERVPLYAQVYDSRYEPVSDAVVTATVIPDHGPPMSLPMQPARDQVGRYETEFQPAEPGVFEVTITATRQGMDLGTAIGHFWVTPHSLEPYRAGQNPDLLERLALTTGGRFIHLGEVSQLPKEMSYINRPNGIPQILPLWDIPALYAMMILALLFEWALRKRYRLP